jgi:predicted nucleic acid-binding protein
MTILFDCNILSTFAKIDELDLLFRLFKGKMLATSPTVYEELITGIAKGYSSLEKVLNRIKEDIVQILSLTKEEIFLKGTLPCSFDEGERELVAVCKKRGYILATNEKIVKNYCTKENIHYLDLSDILRALWVRKVVSKNVVIGIIERIKKEDRIMFKRVDSIFT